MSNTKTAGRKRLVLSTEGHIAAFDFDSSRVRVINDGEGRAWFVGRDVTKVLGYVNANDAMRQHCRGIVKHDTLPTAGGRQKVRVLGEPDVMRLIVNSKLPAAERFERWVFEAVLPAVRRDGTYTVPAFPDSELGLWSKRMTLERREATSAALASQGSQWMHDRRRDKVLLAAAIKVIEASLQADMFGGSLQEPGREVAKPRRRAANDSNTKKAPAKKAAAKKRRKEV